MPFPYRGETKELNELTRKEASGSFIQLSDGVTHFQLSNPDAEETVVLIHGFSVPSFIYDPTFEFLTQSGLRVLRYDLFGRGFSDRPPGRYNIDLFVRQLGDLLDGLHFRRPVSLMGLSMGGSIAATFLVRAPERVNKLILIGPTGGKSLLSRRIQMATLPVIGELVGNLVPNESLVGKIASDYFDPAHMQHFLSRYLVQMQYKGFKRAILSTIRNGMIESFLDCYIRIGKMNKPVLLFWGRQDPTVPFHHSDALRSAMPQVEFHPFENCGHIPHYEKPDQANPILLKFLRN
jgi:pimeloyl-ACP methyl ester carboxylesterase